MTDDELWEVVKDRMFVMYPPGGWLEEGQCVTVQEIEDMGYERTFILDKIRKTEGAHETTCVMLPACCHGGSPPRAR